MAECGKMDAKLMCTPRPRIEEHMGHGLAESSIDLILGHGFLRSSRAGRELLSFLGVAADRQLNQPMSSLRNTPDQGFVDASNRVLFELRSQMPVRLIRLRNHHHPRRILI